jgi:hypothetical protein
MTRVAYILLAHKDPAAVVAQAEMLTDAGSFVAIHFDAAAPSEAYGRILAALSGNPRVAFAARRHRCGWGEWSLVAATLSAARTALQQFPGATHFHLISGDCWPIKPARYIRETLAAEDADLIEAVDFHEAGWIKTGMREDRLIYRHFFNERAQRRLFYASLGLQRRLGLNRPTPQGLRIMIGSQWWCLRRRTLEAIFAFLRRRRDVIGFFRTTWIPDETFFQTVVRHLVPDREIISRPPTFLAFTDYGLPLVFHDDHHDILVAQEHFFARKVSANAVALRQRLGKLHADDDAQVAVAGQGHTVIGYLTQRGRIGRRYAPCAWEEPSRLGPNRQIWLIAAKKWHVGRGFAEALKRIADIAVVGYVFDEDHESLPDLGGIGSSKAKRRQHPESLLRLLIDIMQTDRLAVCVDPGSIDIIRQICDTSGDVRVLVIESNFSDEYLLGHAQRIGLVDGRSPPAVWHALLPGLREELAFEIESLQRATSARFNRLPPATLTLARVAMISRVFDLPESAAHAIAERLHRFED